jgi:hypothetical protein
MPDITITPRAEKYIVEKSNSPAVAAGRVADAIPRLKWASRVTWTSPTGVVEELGPCFFFSWAKPEEVAKEGDIIVDMVGLGALAIAGGKLLASGAHTIDLSGDRLVLTPPL